MKKRSRILVLILTAMLSTEPVQIVYAETAEATHVTSKVLPLIQKRKMQITLQLFHRKLILAG